MKPVKLSLPPFSTLMALAVVAMLGLQGLFEYYLLVPLAGHVATLSQNLQQRREQIVKEAPSRPKTALRLEEALSHLQDQNATDARIEKLHQIADENGVVVRKASYRSQALQSDLWRHEIQADLAGAYPAVRQFLRTVQTQDEAAALDSVEFTRPPGSNGVRAQVRLSLYFRRIAP